MRLTNPFRDFEGYLGKAPVQQLQKFMVTDNIVHEIHTVTVHYFSASDSEDPDLYAAVPIMNWQESEQGQWVMEHAVESPMWHRMIDAQSFGWKYAITAKLKGPDYTFYTLKWGQSN
jgi:hypothetical protein